MRVRRVAAVFLVLLMSVAAAFVSRPYVRGLAFVVRASDMHGALRRAADATTRRVTMNTTTMGRLYRPEGTAQRLVLLVPGLHAAGLDEPRLVALATTLAASGLLVVTPDIPELTRFEVTPAVTDAIESAASALADLAARERTTTTDGRVGLVGVGFSGGLSVVAGGRTSVRDRLAFVMSIGGHHDLQAVMRYLCAGGQSSRPPDAFGAAIVLLNVAERVVPSRQVEAFRGGVRAFLSGFAPGATGDTAGLKKLARSLPEPSATFLRYVAEGDLAHLGSRLLPYVGAYASPAGLSPAKSPKPGAPVLLLHGAEDNLVPFSESEHLAGEIVGRTPVRLLVSEAVADSGFSRTPGITEALQLGGFWGEVFSR